MSDFQTSCLTYNALNTRTSAVASGGTGGTYALENYNYDSSTGNLSSKGGVSYTYNAQVNCTGGNRTIPHAVSGAGGNSYIYDCNGNQVTRTIGTNTYNLIYDAENRLTAVSGATTASFVYDGDGNRVKGTSGGMTTTYIGNYFEWTGSTSSMKKYYYDGATRVAMRTGNSTGQTTGLNWLFGDHLGSTSITADSSGNRSGELRYKGWGELRFTSGTTPTSFQFTGQRNESTLGLYFYNSRWFDPALGRFIQADSMVPNPLNSQSLDRYAYVLNNPTNNVDPSGHRPCNGEDNSGWCVSDRGWNRNPVRALQQTDLEVFIKRFKITFSGIWNPDQMRAVMQAVLQIARKLVQYIGGTYLEAFLKVFGALTFTMSKTNGNSCEAGANGVTCYTGTKVDARLIVHELGHTFAIRAGYKPYTDLGDTEIVDDEGNHVTGKNRQGVFERIFLGYNGEYPPNVYHGKNFPAWNSPSEDFADMFMNWGFDTFDYSDTANGAGTARFNWMDIHMMDWINLAIQYGH
jgi:RHS repeat-associated protein